MGLALGWLGERLARFLARATHVHGIGPATSPNRLLACLKPGDVLLVEGNSRVSAAIKYLTESTWSHAAHYVGTHLAEAGGDPDHCFIEADMVDGVRSVGIDEFDGLHTRICRPVGLSEPECRQVTAFAIAHLGDQYDLAMSLIWRAICCPRHPCHCGFAARCWRWGAATRPAPFAPR